MMTPYTLVRNFQDKKQLRDSFNFLASETFGLSFEKWYQYGYWTKAYQPYSLVLNNQIVANASVNFIDVIMDKKLYHAAQIGTVMTHSSHRNKGLAKELLTTVINEIENQVDFIYLFANKSVINFYPKFNFKQLPQYLFSLTFQPIEPIQYSYRKLNMNEARDRNILLGIAQERVPNSKVFSTFGTENLILFYGMYVFSDCIYYFDKKNLIIISKQIGNQLQIYDVISKQPIDNMKSIISSLVNENVTEIIFHFTPDRTDQMSHLLTQDEDTIMFVRTKKDISFPKVFKHPLTAQA